MSLQVIITFELNNSHGHIRLQSVLEDVTNIDYTPLLRSHSSNIGSAM